MTLVPIEAEPTSLVAVSSQCEAVEAWAAQCDSVPQLKDAVNRLGAIDEYLARTSTEGRGRVAAAMRRLEVRIGQLLPAQQGRRTDMELPRNAEEVPLNAEQAADFRRMAANPDLVEQVIADSTDESPASRRKVTGAIKGAVVGDAMGRLRQAMENNPVTEPKRLPLQERAEQIRTLAGQSLTSPQIADRLGMNAEHVRKLARRVEIDIPADAVFNGRFRRVDPNRLMAGIVADAEIPQTVLAMVTYSDLDPTQIEEWVSSLSASIRSLTTIRNNLKKELTRDEG